MNLNGYINLSLEVIEDWRVIFAALASIIVWSILRRVGAVYHTGAQQRPRASYGRPRQAPRREPPRSSAPAASKDEELIE